MRFPIDATNPVVFFANGVGDTIMSLPALRALTRIFPDTLTLVCPEYNFRVGLAELPMRRIVMPREFSVPRVLDAIGCCDLFISLLPGLTFAHKVLLEKLKAKTSVGFFPGFTIKLPLETDLHVADLAFKIPQFFDKSLMIGDFSAPPQVSTTSRSKATALRAFLPSGSQLLTVHADTCPNKMWPAERFIAVLDLFLDHHPDFFVFVIGWKTECFEGGSNADRIIPCCDLPLGMTFGLLAEADLFLGVDSSMLHVADFFGIPGVGLFGPTDSRRFGFRFSPHRHVSAGNSMNAIEVAAVLEALESVWSAATSGHQDSRAVDTNVRRGRLRSK